MPKTENGHTEKYWLNVKVVSSFLLTNQEFLECKRGKHLARVVMDELGCEERMAMTYIAEARKEIKLLYTKNVDKKIRKALRDREDQIRSLKLQLADAKKPAEKARFFQLLQTAYKDRDEILGLYEKKEKTPGEANLNLNIDYSKLNSRQLQRLAAGEDIRAVLVDTDNGNPNDSTDKSQS